jgi:hypothetical protein
VEHSLVDSGKEAEDPKTLIISSQRQRHERRFRSTKGLIEHEIFFRENLNFALRFYLFV